MAETAKKGKKKKGKTLALTEFLAKDGEGSGPSVNHAAVFSARSTSWADESENLNTEVDTQWPEESYGGTGKKLRAAMDRAALPTAPRASRGPDIDSTKLPEGPPFTAFLGNLSYDVDKDDIMEFFVNVKITEVRLPQDNNGRLKGFGYAEFEDKKALLEALTLNNEHLKNRRIRVDVAGQQQQERERGDRDGRSDEPDRTDSDWRSKPAEPPRDENGYGRDRSYDDAPRDQWRQPRGYDDGPPRDRYSHRGNDDGPPGGYGRDRGYDDGPRSRDNPSSFDNERRYGDAPRDRRGDGDYGDRDRGGRGFGSGWGGGDRDRPDDRYDDRGGYGRDRNEGRRGYGDRGYGGDRYESRGGGGYESRGGGGYESRGGGGYGRDRYDDRRYGDRDRNDDRRGGGPERYDDRRGGDRYGDRGDRRRDDDREQSSWRNMDRGRADVRSDFDRDEREPVKERPKLQLKPRTKPSEEDEDTPAASSSVFGNAKPVDTAAKEREIEERLARQKLEDEAKLKEKSRDRREREDFPRGGGGVGRPRRDSNRSSDGERGPRERRDSAGSHGRRDSARSSDDSTSAKDSVTTPKESPREAGKESKEVSKEAPKEAPPPVVNVWAKRMEQQKAAGAGEPKSPTSPVQGDAPSEAPKVTSPPVSPDRKTFSKPPGVKKEYNESREAGGRGRGRGGRPGERSERSSAAESGQDRSGRGIKKERRERKPAGPKKYDESPQPVFHTASKFSALLSEEEEASEQDTEEHNDVKEEEQT